MTADDLPYIKVYVIDYGRKFLMLQWSDPETKKRCSESSKTSKKREANIKAVVLEKKLNDEFRAKHLAHLQAEALVAPTGDGIIAWQSAFDLYQTRELSGMDDATRRWHISKLNVFGRTSKIPDLASVTASKLSEYIGQLRTLGRAEDTIRGHLIAIRAILEWSQKQGYITTIPKMPEARTPNRRRRKVKGRNLTFWEFIKLLRAVPLVVMPHQVASWRHLLIGIWVSGLRLNEAAKLSWDNPMGIRINFKGEFPVMEIDEIDDKGREYRMLPITPDFHRWLSRVPEDQRTGDIFAPIGERGEPIRNETNLSRTISDIGEAAKIIVDHRRLKYASAHDLRRTFGTRWALIVEMEVLQQLMRHKDIETTKTYYIGVEAQTTAAKVWKTLTRKNHTTLSTTPAIDKPKNP